MWTICVCAASQNKEWKPKSSQKPSLNGLGVIGTPTKSASPPVHNSKDLDAFKVKKKPVQEREASTLRDEVCFYNLLAQSCWLWWLILCSVFKSS